MGKHPKRPRDANQLAKLIVKLSTGDAVEKDPDAGKNPAAVSLGRKGGLRSNQRRGLRRSEHEARIDQLCRAAEPDHAYEHAPVYAANQRVQQKGRESRLRRGAPLHALQLRTDSQNATCHSSDAGRAC